MTLLCGILLYRPRSHRVILGEHDRQSNNEQIQVVSISRVSYTITQQSLLSINFAWMSHFLGTCVHCKDIKSHYSYDLCSPLRPGHHSPLLQRPELQQWYHPSEAVLPSTDDIPCVPCVPGLLQHQHPIWNQMCHQWVGQDGPNLWVNKMLSKSHMQGT